MILGACTYSSTFSDCAVHCTADAECPEGLACGGEGLCRTSGVIPTCGTILGDAGSDAAPFPSCNGLPTTCGPAGTDDCCTSPIVSGGMFYRSHDVAIDGMYPSTSYPATVSDFRLDRFEVTVGRFRQFVEADMGTQSAPPLAGTGAHAKIAGSGWDASWNGSLAPNTAVLETNVKCDATYQTWTDAAGANESLPINCIDWYEAMAFCIWDGGFLPTESEWNYAAAGGDEQRAYPWSSPAGSTGIDCSYANYKIDVPSGARCVNGMTGATNRVGSESPKGDGKWGQVDLAGNAWEWNLDWQTAPYMNPCTDCANLTTAAFRIFRGGSFNNSSGPGANPRTATRNEGAPSGRDGAIGARCARAAP